MTKLIERIGFFRLTLIPLGTAIIISAFINEILGMGLVGGIVFVFGIFNRCLLLGKCEVERKPPAKAGLKKDLSKTGAGLRGVVRRKEH